MFSSLTLKGTIKEKENGSLLLDSLKYDSVTNEENIVTEENCMYTVISRTAHMRGSTALNVSKNKSPNGVICTPSCSNDAICDVRVFSFLTTAFSFPLFCQGLLVIGKIYSVLPRVNDLIRCFRRRWRTYPSHSNGIWKRSRPQANLCTRPVWQWRIANLWNVIRTFVNLDVNRTIYGPIRRHDMRYLSVCLVFLFF